MQPEDLYDLTWVADPRLSPDGQTVAFVVVSIDRQANDYASSIWTAPVDGSAPPRRFTVGDKADGAPRWSPDGTRIAFLSKRDGDARQLYVIPATGGEALRLTELDEGASDPVWSPDGTRIAFASRVRDEAYAEEDERRRRPRRFTRLQFKLDNVGWTGDRRQHLFTVPADGSAEPTQLTHGDFEDGGPTWSPDGTRIAFASARDDDWDLKLVGDVYVVDADGGEPERLTGGDSSYDAPSWSPDGSQIACRWAPGGFDTPQHGRIAVVDAETGERRVLTADLDLNCAPYPDVREPVWDGDSIAFVLEQRGNNHLYRVRADGSAAPDPVVDGEVWVNGFDVAAGTVVHTATTPTMPTELFCGERRLTEVTRAFTDGRELVAPEPFTAVSADGSEVDAWLVRPVGFEEGRRYPVLLSIHGGPFSQYGNAFFDEFQVEAGAGYVVLYSNPRGSSGGTEAWGRAIRGPIVDGPGWGTVDFEDLMAVVDTALEQFDFCDPDRLGVLGGSYGGYMTTWIVGHTDRFRAACSERAVNNWTIESGTSDIGIFFTSYVGAHWFEEPDVYRALSPATYAPDITTPLLIVHSEDDLRCPVGNAEELFAILRLLDREVELVRFPCASHELSRSGAPAQRVMRFDLILEWFARHLAPQDARAASPVGAVDA